MYDAACVWLHYSLFRQFGECVNLFAGMCVHIVSKFVVCVLFGCVQSSKICVVFCMDLY